MQNQLPFSRNLLCAIVAVLVAITGVAASGGALAQQGGPGAMSPDQRRAFFQSLSEEERSEFFSMSPEEKSKFIQSRAKQAGTKGSPAGGKPPAANGRRGPPPTLVQLGEVTREPMIKIFPITGRVVAIQRSEIAANIKGSVNRVLVEIGDRVKMGQVLAELNVDRLKLEAEFKAAEVLQARAKWKFAQAQVNLLKQELKRLERLRKSAAFSQARFEDKSQEIVKADASVDDTAAALSRARASRDLARIDLKDATIRAPFPGVILGKHVSPGTYLNAGTRIVTLLNDENVEIEVDIPSDRIGEIIDGKILTAWIDGKTKIEAAVRAVIPDENPLARTRAVRLTPNIEPTKIRLVPNQNVIVDVPGSNGGRDVIAVPKDAIVNQQSGRIVFVFADGRVRPARVEIGESFANKFEIKSGLSVGQKIVVRGNELLRPGQTVRVSGGGASGRPNGTPAGPPAGAPGGSPLAALPPEKRRAFFQGLTPEDRQKFFAMSPEDKRNFVQSRIGANK